MNITWKDVLNSQAPYARNWKHIDNFLPIVDMVGYRYFVWNGKVLELVTTGRDLSFRDTGLTEEDLE